MTHHAFVRSIIPGYLQFGRADADLGAHTWESVKKKAASPKRGQHHPDVSIFWACCFSVFYEGSRPK